MTNIFVKAVQDFEAIAKKETNGSAEEIIHDIAETAARFIKMLAINYIIHMVNEETETAAQALEGMKFMIDSLETKVTTMMGMVGKLEAAASENL